jgi:photosystem II stability/assembly factor-like uncharacterized protein
MKAFLLQVLLFILPSYAFSQAQSAWAAIPGAPSTYRIEDIAFVQDTIAYLVADSVFTSPRIFKSIDRGQSWLLVGNSPVMARSIEFINEQTGFIGTVYNPGGHEFFFKTTDGGQTIAWIDTIITGQKGSGICGIAHLDSLVLAVGSVNGDAEVLKSTDAGLTWIRYDLDSLAGALIDVYIIDSLTYLVSGQANASENRKAILLKTTDGGLNWSPLIYSAEPLCYGWKIFMGPDSLGLVSVEDFNGASVFRTADYGNSWYEITIPGGLVEDLGAVGLLNDTLGWLAQQHGFGMYETQNGGLSWSYKNYGSNLNRMVKLDSVTMIMVGNTVHQYRPGFTGLQNEPNKVEDFHNLNLYPNPASVELIIDLELKSGTFLMVTLNSGEGKLIKTLVRENRLPGKYLFKEDIRKYPSGTYVVHMVTREQNIGKKIVVKH